MAKIKQLPAKSLIFFIILYRYSISPLLGNRCRFYPSCSVYAIEALKNKGFFTSLRLVMHRLSKCHPWHPGGYDPLPGKEKR